MKQRRRWNEGRDKDKRDGKKGGKKERKKERKKEKIERRNIVRYMKNVKNIKKNKINN